MRFEASTFLTGRLKRYFVLIIAVFLSFLFLISSEATWKSERTEGYCKPNNKIQYPFIPYMPAVTYEETDTELYNFIEDYIHWRYNETIVDFHRPSNLSRRKTAYLQTPLLKAINHSKGEAKKENAEIYNKSQSTYIRLKKCNCGYIFNINAIENIIKTKYTNIFHVTVLGEWQITGDKQYSNEDPKMWGFKRIWLTIVLDKPKKDTKGNFMNPTGFYVTYQDDEDLDYYNKDLLMKKIDRKGFLLK